MTAIPAALLAKVPGLESGDAPRRVQPLAGGRGANGVWRVQSSQGDFVLRLRHPPQDRPGSFSRFELESHRRAASAGLAPAIVAAAPDGQWLLMDHVDAPAWSEAMLTSTAGMAALGSLLRRLHALDCTGLPPMDAGAIARGYGQLIAVRHPDRVGAAAPEIAALESEAEALPPRGRLALTHGDLMAANLVGPCIGPRSDGSPPAGLFLVDWEYAQCAHPTWDIACLLAYYPSLDGLQERLLEACGLACPEDRHILSIQRRLFSHLNRLWQLAEPSGSG